MADDEQTPAADGTAVRVALWRAMHVQVDPPPHVLEDEIGLRLAAPDDGWRHRPDMDPAGTSRFRAAIVARARFIEAASTPLAKCWHRPAKPASKTPNTWRELCSPSATLRVGPTAFARQAERTCWWPPPDAACR